MHEISIDSIKWIQLNVWVTVVYLVIGFIIYSVLNVHPIEFWIKGPYI